MQLLEATGRGGGGLWLWTGEIFIASNCNAIYVSSSQQPAAS